MEALSTWQHFFGGDTDPKGSLWDVASQGEAVSVTSFLQEAALKKNTKICIAYKRDSCIHIDSFIMFQKNM